MQTKELKSKDKSELSKLLYEKKEALRSTRANTSGGKSRNVKEIANLRKDVARIMTLLNSK